MATNQDLAAQLYSQLETALFGPNTGDSGTSLFVMCWPGIFVPTGPESQPSQVFYQTQILDRCLNAGFLANRSQTFKQQLGTLSDWYYYVLYDSMLAQHTYSGPEQKQIDADNSTIAAYKSNASFMQIYQAYGSAKHVLAAAQLANSDDLLTIQDQFKAAQQDYITAKGAEYDAAIASLRNLTENANPDVLFSNLKDTYNLTTLRDKKFGEFKPTYLSVPADSWGSASWTHAKLTMDSKSSSASSHSTSWNVGGGLSFGLWSFGGGDSGSSTVSNQDASDDNISVELDYLRVGAIRPWIHEDIFTLRNWAWDPDSFTSPNSVSGGKPFALAHYAAGATTPDVATSRMPVIIEEMIVVQNVTLSGGFSASTLAQAQSQSSANTSFGWGPFSVSGSYSTSDSSMNATSNIAGNTITIKTPQVIGFFVSVLPECPNPDPGLAWLKPPPTVQ